MERITGNRQQLIDALNHVRNERPSVYFRAESGSNAESAVVHDPIKKGFGFALGFVGFILLVTIVPFVLSAIMAAIWSGVSTGIETPVKSTNAEFLMWLFAAYVLVGVAGFIWYRGRARRIGRG
jgi:hypothetical protein